ncbi:MAG: efflux RND transporter periplasmic adaptor subunit [Syntrophomonas sp.]
MKKCSSLLLALMLAGMFLAAGCNAGKDAHMSSTPASVTGGNGSIYFMAGEVEAGEEADISSKITARVANISFDIGSKVAKGDPLIQLNTRDLEDQAAHANAVLAEAQAAMVGTQAGYAKAQNDHDRNQALFNAGAIAKSQLEQSLVELAAADSAFKSAQARVEQARATLLLASTQLGNGIITSPISGVISVKNINPGELAVAGAQLLTVVNTDGLIVNAYLPASLVSKVKAGQKVTVKIAEVPDKFFNGQISLIDAVIDNKCNNVLVKVRLTDQDPLLKPGMFAEIALNQEAGK